MIEAIILKMVMPFTTKTLEVITPLIKDFGDEVKDLFSKSLEEYLKVKTEKFEEIKTLLHREIPVKFYDIYQPTKLKCEKCNNKIIETINVKDIFQKSKLITVIGNAGSGKSTLIKHLFLNTIKTHFSIPILIELRHLNNYEKDISDYLKEKIFNNKLATNDKILERLLENGKFIFFLDGYDEISESRNQNIVKNLEEFIEKYGNNHFLITSRPFSNIELFSTFHNYQIKDLSIDEVKEFIEKQKIEEELKDKIIKTIEEKENKEYVKEFLTNSLLLTLFIITFQENSNIPNKKSTFYRRVIDTLFIKHDSFNKFGYKREFKTKLSQEGIEEILQKFSLISYFDGHYDFEIDYLNEKLNQVKKNSKIEFNNSELIEDLKLSIALWMEDGGIISFVHRSIQEYFTALFIKNSNNKEEFYKKIEKRLENENVFIEMFNLLKLCQEMDKLNFNKYFLLPSLQTINSLIQKDNIYSKIISIIQINFLNISFKNNKTNIVTPDYKNIFPLLQYYNIVIDEIINKLAKFIDGKKTINCHKELTKELIEPIIDNELIECVEHIITNINQKIKYIESIIASSEKSEDDLLDLI